MKPTSSDSDQSSTRQPTSHQSTAELISEIKTLAQQLGFQDCGISSVDLDKDEKHLQQWLGDGFHGEMEYMQRHGTKRSRPAELETGTVSVICVRMDYFPEHAANADQILQKPALAYVSRYALGRDYHKLMRKRLQQLANKLEEKIGAFGHRVFVDSAPVLEKALARNAGLGWIGKHSNLLHQSNGSWFFLGEIYTDLPLVTADNTVDSTAADSASAKGSSDGHCGSCTACIDACPTNAIVAPYRVDARRCISYLTIELRSSIPEHLRKPMGNRIYGCDDCQLVCPFNKFSDNTCEADFEPRHELDSSKLETLFEWSETTFLEKTAGSAIRRIGYECWLRNIAVALGNAPAAPSVVAALKARSDHPSALVREHVAWALEQQQASGDYGTL